LLANYRLLTDGQDTDRDPTFERMAFSKYFLLPFSWLYALILKTRHWLYDKGLLNGRTAAVKTIIIGNLEFGGTGKSPHTLWVANQLKDFESTAILSRGYGRRSKGFFKVNINSHTQEVGDEPLMMKQTCPELEVAVCEDRLKGIETLAEEGRKVIILDDAFQHRPLRGGLRMLITTFERPFTDNRLVPAGTLRDLKSRASSADIVIVSKCPPNLSEKQCEKLKGQVSTYSNAKVYFSEMVYNRPVRLDGREGELLDRSSVIVLSALAHNEVFQAKVGETYNVMHALSYTDHHRYSAQDLGKVKSILSTFAGLEIAVLTTAKDAVKLKESGWVEELGEVPIFVLPLEVRILNDEAHLIEQLNAYVRTNQGNN
jgi:tetraacyldisaccharide 4'-kinase